MFQSPESGSAPREHSPGRGLSSRRIGDVARSFGIHPQTLRLYERAGLLRPRRTTGNIRRYADDDLERLKTILQLTRDRGINLAGVGMVLELLERIGELERELDPWPRAASGASPD